MITFPSNPNVDEIFEGPSRQLWRWDGIKWVFESRSGGIGEVLPVGTILPFGGSRLPNGFLWCDGASYLRVSYPELAKILGSSFGGDTTHFSVPDSRNNVLVGAGDLWELGELRGEFEHTLTIAELASHTHIQDEHNHNLGANQGTAGGGGYQLGGGTTGNAGTLFRTATNQNTGGGAAHNNVQPSLGINYIIKAKTFGEIQVELVGVPECGRLTIEGSSPSPTLKYIPYKGNQIRIGSELYQLPDAGVTSTHVDVYINGVSGQTLSGSTLYYVYLFDDDGILKFDFSTTGHITGSYGIEVKNDDETRVLVGLLQTATTPSAGFYDQQSFRFIRSWFNRNRAQGYNSNNVGFTATATVQTVVPVSFVSFEETILTVGQAFFTGNPTANVFFTCGLDGVAAMQSGVSTPHTTAAYENVAPVASWLASEGYHVVNLRVHSSVNTALAGGWNLAVTIG